MIKERKEGFVKMIPFTLIAKLSPEEIIALKRSDTALDEADWESFREEFKV
jgi:hypothetical protein